MLRLLLKKIRGQDYKRHVVYGMSFSYIIVCFATCVFLSGCNPVDIVVNEVQKNYTESVIGEPKEVTSISEGKIGYETLTEEQKKCYDEILDCILSHEESCALCIFDHEEVAKAYEAVFADYGGLFWVNGYSYKTYESSEGEKIGFQFSPTYTMSREERENYQLQIDGVVEQWIANVPVDADDYTKSKYVFELLINNVEYDINSENNQNIISVFLGGSTVCQGYADAASYLFDVLSVKSVVVSGEVNGQAHAWNLVQLDGEYYYIDVTWGNSTYMTSEAEYSKHINYAYLNVTGEDLSVTHTLNMQIALPEAVGTVDNYFRHEGLYYDAWDSELIGNALAEAYYSGMSFFSVRFSDVSIYDEAVNYFFKNQSLFLYCNGLSKVNYIEDKNMNVLTINYP